jgi:hypothetical protein
MSKGRPLKFSISRHALTEMERRGILRRVLESVLDNPQQVVPGCGGTKVYQSQVDFGGKIFLIRAIVDEQAEPPRVVTVYRTTKVSKYWRTL